VAISVKDTGGTVFTFNGAVQKVTAAGAGAPSFAMEAEDFDETDWVLNEDAAQLTVSTYVGLRTAFGPFPVANATGLKVKSGALPKGMALTGAGGKWWVTGFPTKAAGNTRVVLQAVNGKAAGVTFALNYTILPLPLEATGNFNGVAMVSSATTTNFGAVTVTVSASGKISGKILTQPKTYSFTAAGFDATEAGQFAVTNAQFTANFKKETPIPLMFTVDSSALGMAGLKSVGELPTEIDVEILSRNGWSDKVFAPERETALRLALDYETGLLSKAPGGYYTIALPVNEAFVDEELGGENGLAGTGYLTLTVDKKGKTKVAGKLADGTSVSMAGTLLLFGGQPSLMLYTAPKAYSGGCFMANVGIAREPVTGRVLLEGEALWESKNARATGVQGDGFLLALDVLGGWYSTKATLGQMYANAADGWFAEAQDWIVTVKPDKKGTGFSALPSCGSANNPACLKLSVKTKTGLFTGSFNENVGAKKPASRKLEGVLTPALTAVYGDDSPKELGFSGRGFFLLPQTIPYKYNKSGDFLLTLDCGCGE